MASESPLSAKGADSVSSNLQFASLARRHTSSLRGCSRQSSFDRFIPTRRGSDHEIAHHLLTSPDTSQNDSPFSPEIGAVGGTPRVGTPMKKRSSRLASEDKVLLFSPKAINTPKAGDALSEISRHMNDLEVTPRSSPKRLLPRSPEKVFTMPDVTDDFYSNILDWSSKNKIAVAIEDQVYAWNVDNADCQPIYTGSDENDEPLNVKAIAWGPRGKHLAIGTQSGNLWVWRSEKEELAVFNGEEENKLCSHGGETNAIVWDKTGAIIYTAHKCGCVHEICARSGKIHRLKLNIQHGASGLSISSDNRYIAVGTNDGSIHIWGLREKKETCCIRAHNAAMKALSWIPWQQSALVSGGGIGDGFIRLWNACSGSKTSEVDTKSQVCCMVVSAEHKELITGHGVNSTDVIIWTLPGLIPVGKLQYHAERVLQLSLSPNENTLASLGADETLVLWKCFEGAACRSSRRKSSPFPCTSPLLSGIR